MIRSRSRGHFTVLALLGVLLAASCANEKTPQAPRPSSKPLRVARYYWPGMYWVDIASEKGWFANEGLKVELIDNNPDYYAGLRAVVDGGIDVNGFSLFDLMLFNTKGGDLVGFLTIDMDNGATGIAVAREVGSIVNLKGRTVAAPRGTFLEYFLGVALQRAGLSARDVTRLDLSPEQTAADKRPAEVAAVVTWEPFLTAASEQWAVRAFDTGDVPGVAPDLLAARRELIRERRADIEALCRVWKRTTEFIEREPEAAYAIIARIYKTTPKEVAEFTRRDRIQSLRDNTTAFTFAPGFESLHGAAQSVNRYLVEEGLVEQPLDTTAFLDGRFVRGLQESEAQSSAAVPAAVAPASRRHGPDAIPECGQDARGTADGTSALHHHLHAVSPQRESNAP